MRLNGKIVAKSNEDSPDVEAILTHYCTEKRFYQLYLPTSNDDLTSQDYFSKGCCLLFLSFSYNLHECGFLEGEKSEHYFHSYLCTPIHTTDNEHSCTFVIQK